MKCDEPDIHTHQITYSLKMYIFLKALMQNKGAFYSSMGNVFESSVSYFHEATIKSCYVPIIRVQKLHRYPDISFSFC